MSPAAFFRGDPPRWLRRVIDIVTKIEIGIAGLGVAMIFGLVLAQAAQRYLPVDGWPWTGELARYCLVWVTFTAAGALVTQDAHIALQLVDNIRRPIVVLIVRVFACLVVSAVGVGYALESWHLIQNQSFLRSPAMRMPLAWLYVLPFVGFVSTAVRGLVGAVVLAVRGVPSSTVPGSTEAAEVQ